MAGEVDTFNAHETVAVARLKLASWLYVNRQRLVRRELDQSKQHIVYHFASSPELQALVDQWIQKTGIVDLPMLLRFTEAVSYEIRVAARLRRGEAIDDLRRPRRRAPSPSQIAPTP